MNTQRAAVAGIVGLGPAIIPTMVAVSGAAAAAGASLAAAGGGLAVFATAAKSQLTPIFERFKELSTAQEAYRKANTKAEKATALEAQKAALEGLNAQQKNAVMSLMKLRTTFENFGKGARTEIFSAFHSGVKVLMNLLKVFEPVVKPVAAAIAQIMKELEGFSRGPGIKKFSAWLARTAPQAIMAFWRATVNIHKGLTELAKKIGLVTNDGKGFLDWLVTASKRFHQWTQSTTAIDSIAKAFRTAGPQVVAFLKAMVNAVGRLVLALGPLGGGILVALTPILNWVAMMAQKFPGLVQGIWAGYLAFRALNIVMAITNVIMNANPATRIAILIIALGVAVVAAYRKFEGFRNVVNAVWFAIKAAVVNMWNFIRPRLAAFWTYLVTVVGPAVRRFWIQYVAPVFRAVGAVVVAAWNRVRPVLAAIGGFLLNSVAPKLWYFYTHYWKVVWWIVSNAIKVAWNVIRVVLTALRNFMVNVVGGAVRRVASVFVSMFNRIRGVVVAAWSFIRPRFMAIGSFLTGVVSGAVRRFAAFFVGVFTRIRGAVAAAWNFIRPRLAAFGSFLASVVSGAVRRFAGFVSSSFTRVRAIISGAWNFIRPKLAAFGAVLTGVVSGAVRRFVAFVSSSFSRIRAIISGAWNFIRPKLAAIGSFLAGAVSRSIRQFVAFVTGSFNRVRTIVSGAWNFIRPKLAAIGSFLAGAVSRSIRQFVAFVTGSFNRIRSIVSGAWDFIRGKLNAMINFMKRNFTGAWNALKTGFRIIWDNVKQTVSSAWNFIRGKWNNLIEFIRRNFNSAWNVLRKKVNDTWNGVKQIVSGAWNFIRGKWNNVIEFIQRNFNSGWNSLRKKVNDTWNNVKQIISSAWNFIRGKWNNLIEFIQRNFNSAWNTLRKKVNDTWNDAKQIISRAWNFIRGKWNNLIEFIRRNLNSAWNTFRKKISDTWNDAKEIISGAWNFIRGKWNNLIEFIRRNLNSAWNTLRNKVNDTWNHLKQIISGAWNFIRGKWNWMINFIRNSLIRGFNELRQNASGHWNGLKDRLLAGFHFIRDKVFNPLKSALSRLPDAFRGAKKAIASVWNGLREVVKAPVRFVLETVWNQGVGSLWGKIDTFLKGKLPDFPSASLKGFARGGVLPGKSSFRQGDDQLVPMRKGEGVYVSEAMQDARERARLFAVNRAAMRGQSLDRFHQGGFARGGILDDDGWFGKIKGLVSGVVNSTPAGMIFNYGKKQLQKNGPKLLAKWLNVTLGSVTKQFGDNMPAIAASGVAKHTIETMLTGLEERYGMGGGGQAANVIKVAEKYVGMNNDSNNKFQKAFNAPNQPWCAMFISEVFKEAGAAGALGGVRSAAVETFAGNNGMKKRQGGAVGNAGEIQMYRGSGANPWAHMNLNIGGGMTIGGNESNAVRKSSARIPDLIAIPNYSGGTTGGGGPGKGGMGASLFGLATPTAGVGAGIFGGGMGAGAAAGKAYATSFGGPDEPQSLAAGGWSTSAGDYVSTNNYPLGTKFAITGSAGSGTAEQKDFGPDLFVQKRYGSAQLIDLGYPFAAKILGSYPANGNINFRVVSRGSGKSYRETAEGKSRGDWTGLARGGLVNDLVWVGEEGPELLDRRTGTVFNTRQSMGLAQIEGFARGTPDAARRYREALRKKREALRKKRLRKHESAVEALKDPKRMASITKGFNGTVEQAKAAGQKLIWLLGDLLIPKKTKKSVTGIINAAVASLTRSAAHMAVLQTKLQTANAAKSEAAGKAAEFLGISGLTSLAPKDMIAVLKEKLATVASTTSLVKGVAKKGFDPSILSTLFGMDIGAAQQFAKNLLSASSAQVRELNTLIMKSMMASLGYGDMAAFAATGSSILSLQIQIAKLQAQMQAKANSIVPSVRNRLFDNGGYMTDVGFNKTGKPEPVFTDSQWNRVSKLVRYVDHQERINEQGDTITIVTQSDDPYTVMRLLEGKRRKARTTGSLGPVGR